MKLPNWKKAEEYAYTLNLDAEGWAWEFLRRNSDYVVDFAEYAALIKFPSDDYDPNPQAIENKPADLDWRETPSLDFVGWEKKILSFRSDQPTQMRILAMARKWWLRKMVDPQCLVPTGIFLEPKTRNLALTAAQVCEFPFVERGDTPRYVYLCLDLKGNIRSQMRELQHEVLFMQESPLPTERGRISTSKFRPRNYPDYLRVLDGKAQNYGYGRIAKAFYPNRPEIDGIQRIKDYYQAAQKLVNGAYKGFICRGK